MQVGDAAVGIHHRQIRTGREGLVNRRVQLRLRLRWEAVHFFHHIAPTVAGVDTRRFEFSLAPFEYRSEERLDKHTK